MDPAEIKKVVFICSQIFIRMRTKQKNDDLLLAETNSVVSRIAQIFDAIASGDDLDEIHDQWGEPAQQALDDVEIMSGCLNCGELNDQFWLYLTRLKMPVVFKCRYTSPISLMTFFVFRRAKLSLYRIKHGQFNEDELARITKALSDMSRIQFRIYDARRTNVNLNLDEDESYILVSM